MSKKKTEPKPESLTPPPTAAPIGTFKAADAVMKSAVCPTCGTHVTVSICPVDGTQL